MQQLNPSEISDLIRSKIENLSLAADVRTQGTVVTVPTASAESTDCPT